MHTQERLKIGHFSGTYATTESDLTQKLVFTCPHGSDPFCDPSTGTKKEVAEANARRLVACWNACEGIETEALESGLLRQILVELKRQSEAARGEGVTA